MSPPLITVVLSTKGGRLGGVRAGVDSKERIVRFVRRRRHRLVLSGVQVVWTGAHD